MTTYRLPEALGGGEYEGSIEERLAGVIRLNFVGRAIYVPADMLTEIKPPIPAEPEPGAYLIGDAPWFRPADARGARWVGPDGICWEWEQAWRRSLTRPDVTITPLVPSVPVEPVQLPWTRGPLGHEISVREPVEGDIPIVINSRSGPIKRNLSTLAARSMAAALLSAADRSETP